MFRKSTINTQLDIFSSPAQMMGKRESNQYEDPNAWHNKFYRILFNTLFLDVRKLSTEEIFPFTKLVA